MKTTNIVFLLGVAGGGKDSVGKAFVEKGYTRVSFADKLKEEYAKHADISVTALHQQGPLKEQYRAGLIEYAEWMKKKDPLVWLNKAFFDYRKPDGSFKDNIKLVITDFRRDVEVDWYYNLWEQIQEFEHDGEFLNQKEHYINLKMFYINRPEVNDSDILTHYTIGKVQGINKIQPGFINAVINLEGKKEISDREYKKLKGEIKTKVEKLIDLFEL